MKGSQKSLKHKPTSNELDGGSRSSKIHPEDGELTRRSGLASRKEKDGWVVGGEKRGEDDMVFSAGKGDGKKEGGGRNRLKRIDH